MNNKNDNECLPTSPELSEVIGLVIKQQRLLQFIKIIGNDKLLQTDNHQMMIADCIKITAELETLVKKTIVEEVVD